ncbi:elongation of fatty acids protein 3-like [Lotus japonicus]|uniref:elongation of fatty acids protein 3-like n=1 Tax=Lotus japonicus TaxID=34305 RepID=UPI00258BE626|nr:elongation of fatty acids protein 3-like [Lotus japonicus]
MQEICTMTQTHSVMENLKYWLLDHPSIVSFRWSPAESWGSTWWFLISSISFYIATAVTLHLILKLFRRSRPIPLGPLPAVHALAMALISVTTFIGMFFSAKAEAIDTRWLWRRNRATPLEWLLCFPLGMRPSGRVFFWSYIFYLSRFLHMFRTLFVVLRHRKLSFSRLFNNSVLLLMAFLWLEFSQSLQVLAILFSSAVCSVVYGYRFWVEIGLPRKAFPISVNVHFVLLGCNLACHVGVLLLHHWRGGCNGIGAWVFNSVLNVFILLQILKSYVKIYWKRRNKGAASDCSALKTEEDMVKLASQDAKSGQ